MLKNYHTSGFLYHPASQQILLQKQNCDDLNAPWTLIGSDGVGKETSVENFKRLLRTLLKLNLSLKTIHSVYDYFHAELKKKHFVSYAEVDELVDFPPTKEMIFNWFSYKEISKLKISKLTFQDIVVGQRVIDSSVRKKSGERTLE